MINTIDTSKGNYCRRVKILVMMIAAATASATATTNGFSRKLIQPKLDYQKQFKPVHIGFK